MVESCEGVLSEVHVVEGAIVIVFGAEVVLVVTDVGQRMGLLLLLLCVLLLVC